MENTNAGVAVVRYVAYVVKYFVLIPPVNSEQGCKSEKSFKDPATTGHIEECESICTRCRFRNPSRLPRFAGDGQCSHRIKERKFTERDICSTCVSGSIEEVIAKREMKEMTELKDQESGEVVCSLCYKRVKSGPRLWICSVCGRVCHNRMHASWVTSKND